MKTGLFILKLGIIFLLSSHIYAEDWGVSLTAVDASGVGAHHTIHLGNCDDCSDGWKFGEDEDDYPNPFSGEFTNIHFFHLDWYGQQDENGNICNQTNFSSDFRSIHQNYDLQSWGIRGNTGGGLPTNIPLTLSWDSEALDSLSSDYELYLYIGENGTNMQDQNSITIPQSDLYLNENNESNIWIKLGACASTGTTTHFFDSDNDGWGSGDISHDFCLGYAPSGWAPNSADLDDDLFCESNLIDDCNVCDGFNQDMDCYGFCFGTAEFDECGVCDGNGIPDGNCDCEGNVIDCANVCGGTSTIEILCEDTDGDNLGNPGTETEDCVDLDNNRLDGCDLPDFTFFLNNDGTVVYNSPLFLAGFQFDIEGATVIGNAGGDAESAGFLVLLVTRLMEIFKLSSSFFTISIALVLQYSIAPGTPSS